MLDTFCWGLVFSFFVPPPIILTHTTRDPKPILNIQLGWDLDSWKGPSLISILKFWKYSIMILALWWKMLSPRRTELGPNPWRYGIASCFRSSFQYVRLSFRCQSGASVRGTHLAAPGPQSKNEYQQKYIGGDLGALIHVIPTSYTSL